ncbi:hypothetical protein AB0K40_09540 [Nonomuraea bangladeshensis]|uniref:Uncharacterized protein n=1 Tax=Nonomuraea bangladeshensis TaxID=404385 RepID=A0ABV3GZL8_9ACTN
MNLEKLEALPLPDGYQAVHDAVQAMLPRIDYPELLLEVNGHTGYSEVMPHLSGSEARRPGLDISQAGALVARSCARIASASAEQRQGAGVPPA